jgi:hypothetical protein
VNPPTTNDKEVQILRIGGICFSFAYKKSTMSYENNQAIKQTEQQLKKENKIISTKK